MKEKEENQIEDDWNNVLFFAILQRLLKKRRAKTEVQLNWIELESKKERKVLLNKKNFSIFGWIRMQST